HRTDRGRRKAGLAARPVGGDDVDGGAQPAHGLPECLLFDEFGFGDGGKSPRHVRVLVSPAHLVNVVDSNVGSHPTTFAALRALRRATRFVRNVVRVYPDVSG